VPRQWWKGGAGPRRRWAWIALGAVLAAAAILRVDVTGPRVHVRWSASIDPPERARLERRYDLREPGLIDGPTNTWRYDLGETSSANIGALLRDPAVGDTAYIDRNALAAVDGRSIRVSAWYPFNDLLRPRQLARLHRSLWLLLAGAILLWAARATSQPVRRNVAIGVLLVIGTAALAFPFDPSFVMMGGSADHIASRGEFESWFGGRVRFEKHLSQVAVWQLYLRLEPTPAAPERALVAMTRLGTAWFVLSALAIGALERWSPVVIRYLALVVLAPTALLYFGWRELGYLSLCVAAFPLLARGIRDGGPRLEAGSAVAGLGAALHGSGLVSLAGCWLAAFGARGRLADRMGRALRAVAWGTAAYLGWMVVYVVLLKLSIQQDTGPGAVNGWRPWSADEMRLGRRAAAILSATTARDLSMSAWIVGAPLLAVAASLWRRYPGEVRAALWYLPPSLLFLIFRWPFDGIGGGMDLVAAGFPALYALAWVAAHDGRRAAIAAALLASAHYGFWRAVLDERFQP
jgi:hypothetical protein